MYISSYPQAVYDQATEALNGNKHSFDALLKDYPEWAALVNAVKGDHDAVKWLLHHQFTQIGILANALLDEPKAAEWLKAQEDPFLGHFFLACKGKNDSLEFLKQTRYHTFLPLAQAIRAARKIRIKDEMFWYKVFRW